MQAGKFSLIEQLIAKEDVVFPIPVYQRNYDWTEKNCERLLADVEKLLDVKVKHFLGSFVVMIGDDTIKVRKLILIDGQQRITTIMVLLKALADMAKDQDRDEKLAEDIRGKYLTNNSNDYKLKLKDNAQLVALLDDRTKELSDEQRILPNYTICKNWIDRCLKKGYTVAQIMDAIKKLEVVVIELDSKDNDDPQMIFESINSTGLALTNSDLIRNYLFMKDKENQESLYNDYWVPIERALKKKNDGNKILNAFFLHYLMLKQGTLLSERDIYECFKHLLSDGHETVEGILVELKDYAEIYKAFAIGSSGVYPKAVEDALDGLRQLKQTTSYPFLMQVFKDYENKVFGSDTLEKICKLILSYHLRRLLCEVPSNTLRGLFTPLYRRIFKVKENKNKYYEAINKFLFDETSERDKFQSDADFLTALQNCEVYRNLALCKFLLAEIENGGKEQLLLNIDNMTIEHIMPQTKSEAWSHISYEEHEKFLHVLGNLTITGYNSELSNKSFEDKVEIIKKYSKATILNKDITDGKKQWGVPDIQKRSHRLAEIIQQRYEIKPVKDSNIRFEYTDELSFDDIDRAVIKNRTLISFKYKGTEYSCTVYANMLEGMIKLLEAEHPGRLRELGQKRFSFRDGKAASITTKKEELIRGIEIIPNSGVFVEFTYSANDIIKFVKKLIGEYGGQNSDFTLLLKANRKEVDEDEDSL